MAFTIEQKFHLVIFLRFRDHGTHKCTSKLSKREVKLVLENFDNFMLLTIWTVCIRIPLFLTKNLHEEKLHDLNIILSIYNTSMRRVVVSVEQFEVSTFCVKKCFFSKMQIHKNHNSLKKYHNKSSPHEQLFDHVLFRILRFGALSIFQFIWSLGVMWIWVNP